MKNHIYIIIVAFSFSTAFCQDGLEESKKLGLISYLNTIKELSENKVLWSEAKFTERNMEKDTVSVLDLATKSFIKEKYALLKWKTDLFINQFSADMIDRNSISLYRKMNKYLSNSTQNKSDRIKKYYILIKEMDQIYSELFFQNYLSSKQSIASVTEILTLAGFNPYSLYKDVKATKEKKIEILIGYLKEMRLKPLSELKKPKEKEEKKDKIK